MSTKVAKGVSWLKTVMLLWAVVVGFKILMAFGQENTGRRIVDAIFMFIGAFLVTGIPAFILGWATGKNAPPISEPVGVSAINAARDSAVSHAAREKNQARVSGDAAYAQALSERVASPTPPPTIENAKPVRAASAVTLMTTSTEQSEPVSLVIDDDVIYAAIGKELETGSTDKGLWTRLFAECDGDENRTKVAYIKQRAEKLKTIEQARLSEIAKAGAFHGLVEQLQLKGYEVKKNDGGWKIREPLGGRLKLNSDTALLEYAKGRT